MAIELVRPRRRPVRPFWEFPDIEREMEGLFARFLRGWPWHDVDSRRGWVPAVDMIDRKDEVVLRADLPGLEDKDIEVSVDDGMLTIRGERKAEREEKDEDYYYCERAAGAFARTLPLPPGIDRERVKATFRKGVLEVHLPKSREAKGRKIEIKAD